MSLLESCREVHGLLQSIVDELPLPVSLGVNATDNAVSLPSDTSVAVQRLNRSVYDITRSCLNPSGQTLEPVVRVAVVAEYLQHIINESASGSMESKVSAKDFSDDQMLNTRFLDPEIERRVEVANVQKDEALARLNARNETLREMRSHFLRQSTYSSQGTDGGLAANYAAIPFDFIQSCDAEVLRRQSQYDKTIEELHSNSQAKLLLLRDQWSRRLETKEKEILQLQFMFRNALKTLQGKHMSAVGRMADENALLKQTTLEAEQIAVQRAEAFFEVKLNERLAVLTHQYESRIAALSEKYDSLNVALQNAMVELNRERKNCISLDARLEELEELLDHALLVELPFEIEKATSSSSLQYAIFQGQLEKLQADLNLSSQKNEEYLEKIERMRDELQRTTESWAKRTDALESVRASLTAEQFTLQERNDILQQIIDARDRTIRDLTTDLDEARDLAIRRSPADIQRVADVQNTQNDTTTSAVTVTSVGTGASDAVIPRADTAGSNVLGGTKDGITPGYDTEYIKEIQNLQKLLADSRAEVEKLLSLNKKELTAPDHQMLSASTQHSSTQTELLSHPVHDALGTSTTKDPLLITPKSSHVGQRHSDDHKVDPPTDAPFLAPKTQRDVRRGALISRASQGSQVKPPMRDGAAQCSILGPNSGVQRAILNRATEEAAPQSVDTTPNRTVDNEMREKNARLRCILADLNAQLRFALGEHQWEPKVSSDKPLHVVSSSLLPQLIELYLSPDLSSQNSQFSTEIDKRLGLLSSVSRTTSFAPATDADSCVPPQTRPTSAVLPLRPTSAALRARYHLNSLPARPPSAERKGHRPPSRASSQIAEFVIYEDTEEDGEHDNECAMVVPHFVELGPRFVVAGREVPHRPQSARTAGTAAHGRISPRVPCSRGTGAESQTPVMEPNNYYSVRQRLVDAESAAQIRKKNRNGLCRGIASTSLKAPILSEDPTIAMTLYN